MGFFKTVGETLKEYSGIGYLGRIGAPKAPPTYKGTPPQNRFGNAVDVYLEARTAFSKQSFLGSITTPADYIHFENYRPTISTQKNPLGRLKDRIADFLY